MAELKNIFSQLDSILESTNLEKVTAESTGFESVPDGYYLCKVDKAELGSTQNGDPKAAFQLTIVDDGKDVNFETGDMATIPHTKNRKIFINYVLTDESRVKSFVANMLKFEDENGDPLLSKECFTCSELINDALDVLIDSRIYVNVNTSVDANNNKHVWNNMISWKRVSQLELE